MVLFIHGKGGNAWESEAYRSVFPGEEIVSFDYKSETPWDFREEVRAFIGKRRDFTLIAVSIGAFFFMSSGLSSRVKEAFFISPVSDMEALILSMMESAGVSEDELMEKGTIGELSWEYLTYVRNSREDWRVPTHVIAGSLDEVMNTVVTERVFSDVTFLEGSHHWLHTPSEMDAVRNWMRMKKT